jgi:imidazolonepropionase-like amidohydrolase
MTLDDGRIVLRNAAVLDPGAASLAEGRAVVVEGGRVVEVEATAAVRAGDATVLDARGMTVMPGLIDAHVHVFAATADLAALEEWSPSYATARAAGILRGMLERGFTTVRDVAGPTSGSRPRWPRGCCPDPG